MIGDDGQKQLAYHGFNWVKTSPRVFADQDPEAPNVRLEEIVFQEKVFLSRKHRFCHTSTASFSIGDILAAQRGIVENSGDSP